MADLLFYFYIMSQSVSCGGTVGLCAIDLGADDPTKGSPFVNKSDMWVSQAGQTDQISKSTSATGCQLGRRLIPLCSTD